MASLASKGLRVEIDVLKIHNNIQVPSSYVSLNQRYKK